MPACLLRNLSTQLGMVNGAQTLVFGVIPHSRSNLLYFDTFNFAYYYLRFLHTSGQHHIVELRSYYMYLLYIESALIMLFLKLLCNISLVFSVKSSVMAKKATFKKKQIGIIPGFGYTK